MANPDEAFFNSLEEIITGFIRARDDLKGLERASNFGMPDDVRANMQTIVYGQMHTGCTALDAMVQQLAAN